MPSDAVRLGLGLEDVRRLPGVEGEDETAGLDLYDDSLCATGSATPLVMAFISSEDAVLFKKLETLGLWELVSEGSASSVDEKCSILCLGP